MQEKQLRETRFSSGVGLLGNTNESARIGGAYNLYFLASEFRDEYLEPVCKILCAHIRTITNEKGYEEKNFSKPSNEVQTIIDILLQKDQKDSLIFNECRKDLKWAFLNGVDFQYMTINNVDFTDATIRSVDFRFATLNDIVFVRAKLDENTTFLEASLKNVKFDHAEFNNASFSRAKLEDDVTFQSSRFRDIKFCNTVFNGEPATWKRNFSNTDYQNKTIGDIIKTGCPEEKK